MCGHMWLTTCSEQKCKHRVAFSESVGLRGRLLRKLEALKAEEAGSEAPDEFLCPITRELMKDPVIAAGLPTSDFSQASLFFFDTFIGSHRVSTPQMGIPMSGSPSRAGSGARTKPVPWQTCPCRLYFSPPIDLWRWQSHAGSQASRQHLISAGFSESNEQVLYQSSGTTAHYWKK